MPKVLSIVLGVFFLIFLNTPRSEADFGKKQSFLITVNSAVGLQRKLDEHAPKGGTVRINKPTTLICTVLESILTDELSRHALLIPSGVTLDLNGTTLILDLRSNSHGIRLSSNSAIRNGTISVVRSENRESQSIWHAAISIGSPYDHGGTTANPSPFSKVSNWRIENMTIDQQIEASAIQLMSEACHGVIKDVRILDSKKAVLGIGLDWGSVGKMTTVDTEIPRMRKLWEQNEIYSTHPHDILIENIYIGRLTRNIDGNNAGIRCSACYNIRIRNVHIVSAASAIAIFGGDCGFEFAAKELRPLAHTGYEIDNVIIDKAFRFGIVLNGMADNVYRSNQKHGYQTLINPVRPGLNGVEISNTTLNGMFTQDTIGMFITAVSDVQVLDTTVKGFELGIRIKNWVNGLRFANSDLSQNDHPSTIFTSIDAPRNLIFE